jgi:hypothetical protein
MLGTILEKAKHEDWERDGKLKLKWVFGKWIVGTWMMDLSAVFTPRNPLWKS